MTLMHDATRDVKDMGQLMGCRSLEWNWPTEAINVPIPECRMMMLTMMSTPDNHGMKLQAYYSLSTNGDDDADDDEYSR